jgi:hypothetical protein
MTTPRTEPEPADVDAIASTVEVLLRLFEDNRAYQRHHETQRLNFSNLLIVISAAIVGAVAHLQFAAVTIPLSLLLVILARFGFVASEKFYERTRYHRSRTEAIVAQIDRVVPGAGIHRLYAEARERHDRTYAEMSGTRLYEIWRWFFRIIGVTGGVLFLFGLWAALRQFVPGVSP